MAQINLPRRRIHRPRPPNQRNRNVPTCRTLPARDQITVEHLLTHTGGGWANDAADPMFMNREMNQAQLIEWTLGP